MGTCALNSSYKNICSFYKESEEKTGGMCEILRILENKVLGQIF
jgi:hypothetical protein